MMHVYIICFLLYTAVASFCSNFYSIPILKHAYYIKQGSIHIPSYSGPRPNHLSNLKNHGQPGSTAPVNFPHRPDQPECQHYIRTGCCRYGSSCKYHHPKERNPPAACTIGPFGLPLRPVISLLYHLGA